MVDQKMNEKSVPQAWIDRIFHRMLEIYGDKFLQRFKSLSYVDLEKTRWGNGLYGLSATDIKNGIEVCVRNRHGYPPSVVEFFHYCKGYSSPPRMGFKAQTSSNTLTLEYAKQLTDKLYGNTDSQG